MVFKPDAFEVLYKVDSFEWNFFRALTVQLLKLAFLAMFGVCAATVLSFPVACVLTFTVLAIGGIGPFLGMSIDEYYVKPGTPILLQGLQYTVKGIATAAEWMLRAFGETRPTALLVEGRLIAWSEVVRTLVIIGVVWTAAALALGYAAFRRKELATYSGHQ
jgi:ABC-type transport system involved in multi-copper enzyme maturation permease subunit